MFKSTMQINSVDAYEKTTAKIHYSFFIQKLGLSLFTEFVSINGLIRMSIIVTSMRAVAMWIQGETTPLRQRSCTMKLQTTITKQTN